MKKVRFQVQHRTYDEWTNNIPFQIIIPPSPDADAIMNDD